MENQQYQDPSSKQYQQPPNAYNNPYQNYAINDKNINTQANGQES